MSLYSYYSDYWYMFPTIQNLEYLLSLPRTNFIYNFDSVGFTGGVVSPNFDTIYLAALLDFRDNYNISLYIPDIKNGRYYSFQFIDVYCRTFHYISKRNNKDLDTYVYLSKQIGSSIQVPGDLVVLIVRIEVNAYDKTDIDIVEDIIRQIKLIGLSRDNPINARLNQTPYYLDIDKPVISSNFKQAESEYRSSLMNQQLEVNKFGSKYNKINSIQLINNFTLLTYYQKSVEVEKIINRLHDYGNKYSYHSLDNIFEQARSYIKDQLMLCRSNWLQLATDIQSVYDKNLSLAIVEYQVLYANESYEATYYYIRNDKLGDPLLGSNKYIMYLSYIPGNDAFWSVMAYNMHGYVTINKYNHYIVGTNTKPIKMNGHSGYQIIFSMNPFNNLPLNNWLPIPEGEFYILLRIYLPLSNMYQPATIYKI